MDVTAMFSPARYMNRKLIWKPSGVLGKSLRHITAMCGDITVPLIEPSWCPLVPYCCDVRRYQGAFNWALMMPTGALLSHQLFSLLSRYSDPWLFRLFFLNKIIRSIVQFKTSIYYFFTNCKQDISQYCIVFDVFFYLLQVRIAMCYASTIEV